MSAHRITCASLSDAAASCDCVAPLMACGHAANAERTDVDPHVPVCVICSCEQLAPAQPDLTGRTARCSYRTRRNGSPCTSEAPSARSLAFFAHHPERAHDEFYCGCWGWD